MTPRVDYVFCIPGAQFSSRFMCNCVSIFEQIRIRGQTFALANAVGAYIHDVRNLCLNLMVEPERQKKVNHKPFDGKLDYKYLVWIDWDNFLTVELLDRLTAHDKDIVAGWYKAAPTIGNVDDMNVTCSGVFDPPGSDFIRAFTADEIMPQTELFKVGFVGFGCVVIKKGVFEAMEYPWFSYKEVRYTDDQGDECVAHEGEDVLWCQNVAKLGYDVWLDPLARSGHEKKLII
jgi:hypothetical protein